MNTVWQTLFRLSIVASAVLWMGACNAPPVDDAETVSEAPPTAAEASPGASPNAPPSTIPLDATTECKLSPQTSEAFPELPFDLPTPPAEVNWLEAGSDNLGTGYIGPVETAANPDTPDYLLVGFANADWIKRVVLPLYDAPNGEVESWMACGWLMLGPEAEQAAMEIPLFYPGYSGFGMLVLAEEGDWLQLHDGVWVLRSHLQASTVPLAYMSWSARYQAIMAEHDNYAADDPAADWGYFSAKTPNTPLALYPAPNAAAAPLAELPPTTSMLPLEMQGDWLRVRTYTPNNFCIEDWQGETREGWVRWMDPNQGGNQIAEPYKGC